jgi:hypothetical protein
MVPSACDGRAPFPWTRCGNGVGALSCVMGALLQEVHKLAEKFAYLRLQYDDHLGHLRSTGNVVFLMSWALSSR